MIIIFKFPLVTIMFRNRIKRLLRESVRTLLLPLELDLNIVLVAKKGIKPSVAQQDINLSMNELLLELSKLHSNSL